MKGSNMDVQVKRARMYTSHAAYEVWVGGKLHSLHTSHSKAWRAADKLMGEARSPKEAAHDWSSRHNDT